jgi:hypothetical protein
MNPTSALSSLQNSNPLLAILWAGFTCGTLDISAALVVYADYRGDVIASDAKHLRFWSRLRRAPTPLRAHSQEPVGRPDSA